MRLLANRDAREALARRMLPVVVVVPIVAGFVRVKGEAIGLGDPPFGTAAPVLAEIALLVLSLVWAGAALRRREEPTEDAGALSANRQRVLDTLESIADAFVTLDAKWRFIYANAQAETLLGKQRSELFGKSLWELFPQKVGSIAYEELQRAATARENVVFEDFDPLRRRWFASRAYPTADGMLAVYFEDVTARKNAEAELALSRTQLEAELHDTQLLQSISTELVVQDDSVKFYEGIVDAAVRIMRSDFGSMQLYHPERGAAGELGLLAHREFSAHAAHFWEWVPFESAAVSAQALRSGRRVIVPDVARDSFLRGTADGETYGRAGIRAVQSTPLLSRSGAPLGMISTHWRRPHVPSERAERLLDILARLAADWIERKQAQKQRELLLENERAARSDAERAARLKDEFLATLSHELRTPLNAVIGWAQILQKDLSNPERVRAAVDIIERNGRQQARLITDLLDVSRIVSGNMQLDLQAVDLSAVIAAAIDSVLPAATAKGVGIRCALDSIAEPVCGDPARLQQMVWNLLSNAVKFTPRGGNIDVTLGRVGAHVEIRVVDSGEGIDADFLPHVFERFRQGDPSTTRRHSGLGLGLAIVRQFAELHGGSVRASSEGRGLGSTFVIELPIATAAQRECVSSPLASERPPAEGGQNAATPLKGVRVLLVEDEPDALTMVQRLLEENEAEVGTALSARSALELLRSETFDVIVSDIGMPERDGYELIVEARMRGISTPALALTAFAGEDDRQRTLAAGYQAHLAKPVDASELIAAVARWAAPPPDPS